MASPYKIPKRKQLDSSGSTHMLSPLSRLQSSPTSGLKTYGDQCRRGGADKVHPGSSLGSPVSRRSGCNSSLHIVVKAQVGANRPNPSTNHRADHRGDHQSASAFSNGRWRPKRASDRLLQSDHSPPPKTNSASTTGISVQSVDSLAKLRGERHAGIQSSSQAKASRDASTFDLKSDRNGVPDLFPSKNKYVSDQPIPSDSHRLSSSSSSSSSTATPGRKWGLNRTAWLSSVRSRTGLRDNDEGDDKETERERWKEFRDRKATRRSAVLNVQPKKPRSRPGPSEPIVLSSEEEDEAEDEGGGAKRLKESCRRMDESNQEAEHLQVCSSSDDKPTPSFLQLDFTSLHVGLMKANANGKMMITDSGITLPLKGDEEGEVSVVASQVQAYGVWDGGVARSGTLLEEWKGPAPSLLFLWVTDAQANLLQRELSEIQTCNSTGPPCPFLLLVLKEQLQELEAALLASILDMDEYRLGRPPSSSRSSLSCPLDWTDGLLLLHSCPPPLDKHLLGLLGHSEKPSPLRSTRSSLSSGPQLLPTRLIQYPPAPSKGRITVTKEDVACLNAGQFLNDVIIDFYLKFLMLEGVGGNVAKRTHVFSSFFYKQLRRRRGVGEDDCASVPDRHTRHQRVKTWTRHVDIFTKDFLFVPVNQEAHWYLVVVCFPGLDDVRLEEFQSPTGGSGKPAFGLRSQQPPECTLKGFNQDTVLKRPCILVMNSLKLSYHESVCRLLREYLQVEWEVRRGTPRRFTWDAVKTFNCRVPQQDNSSDCGLYLLQYAESFLQNPIVHFELPLHLDQWFPRQCVRQKREEIRSLIMRLHRQQNDDDGPNLTPSR